ncbi:MAG: sugar phosphate isomerase/epimerase [Phenylobacterium sp.]|nr:sugar phosphate isomerase/epimerase [Phenylobacterium sp.]
MRTSLFDPSRRGFLAGAAAVAGLGVTSSAAAAQPFFQRVGLPIGIQLYSLGPDAAKDLDATLAAVAAIGYRTVELAGFMGRKPADVRAALDRAGLKCGSAHVQARALGPDGGFDGDLAALAEGLAVVGATHAVMPSPRIPDRLAGRPAEGESMGAFYRRVTGALTLHDWQMNAAFLNEKGAVLKKSGIRIGYHNHNFEFRPLGQTTGMEILLKETDPDIVTFEIDVGWVSAAGGDPVALMQAHKDRFTMMHVKDLKAGTEPNFALSMQPTEVGSGRLDWKRLLPAAYAAGVRGFYVEQEPPFERPRIEAAKICHDYLAGVMA